MKTKTVACITRSEKGSIIQDSQRRYLVKACPVDKMVDTTGAGDCFCGTFAACLHEGMELKHALNYATTAATLSCLRPGAQSSYPYLDDIEKILKK